MANNEFSLLEEQFAKLPASAEDAVLPALERQYSKLTSPRGDPELSLEVIRTLLPLYGAGVDWERPLRGLMRGTVASLTPTVAAIKRVLQWVAFGGCSWVVFRTMVAICSAVMDGGRPGRGHPWPIPGVLSSGIVPSNVPPSFA